MMNVLTTGIVCAVLAMTVVSARAQGTAEERSACMGDAFRFCASDIPNVSEIEACLIRNRPQLTPACSAEFAATGKTKMKSEHFR